MKKQSINPQELKHWMNKSWTLYEACFTTQDSYPLRFWVNSYGRLKVKHGGDVIYEGWLVSKAIDAWDSVP